MREFVRYKNNDSNGTLDPHVNQLTWTYDESGRLTDEVFNHYDNLLDQTQYFTHDLTGNRLSRTLDKGNNGTIDELFTSLFDANDRLTSEQADLDNDGTVDQTTDFGYTDTQQTSKTFTDNATAVVTQSTTYQYNLQGRMSQVVIDSYDAAGVLTRGETLSYDYNPSGIRVQSLEEIDSDANGTFDSRTLTEYLIDAQNDTGYAQVLQETVTDADTGAEIKKVVYTLGLDHIAQTVFESGGPAEGETLVFHMDGHGSTRVLTDMAAAIATVAGALQIFHYDAHGNAIGFNPAAAATSILFSGEQFEATTGLSYNRARWYNPATATWNRLDDFSGKLKDPQSLHKYLYVHGDPINAIDPSGQLLSTMLSVTIGVGRAVGKWAIAHPVLFGGLSMAAWSAVDTALGGGDLIEIIASAARGFAIGLFLGWMFSLASPLFAVLSKTTQVLILSQARVIGLNVAFISAMQSSQNGQGGQAFWRAATGLMGSYFLLAAMHNATISALTGQIKIVNHKSTSGAAISSTAEKSTTVLGRHQSDMRHIIRDLKYPKARSLNEIPWQGKRGGFNILNASDDLYHSMGKQQFWVRVNKPWLLKAIRRGDDIILASPPTPKNTNGTDFGEEYRLLVQNGYKYNPATGRMVK